MDPRGEEAGEGKPARESVSIAVIIDRRYRDRRRADAAQPVERRQGDRRRRNVSEQLKDGGWAVIPVDDKRFLR